MEVFMSDFYNRDQNITGITVPTSLPIYPEYGSTANFKTKVSVVAQSDKNAAVSPIGVNNIVASFSLNFNARTAEAQKLTSFYESQSGTGFWGFSDGSNIYHTQSGVIDSFSSRTSNNGQYSLNMEFAVENNSSILNWSGLSFVNCGFSNWNSGVSFNKYDIAYFEHDKEEISNNFFYATEDHSADFSNYPLASGSKWTQDLFIESNDGFGIQQAPSVKKTEFQNSFPQRVLDQKNIHAFDSLDLSYRNISDKKLKALLHFLETRQGYKRFRRRIPEIYNQPKIFFAPEWTHQWVAKDSNNLSIKTVEDPLGIIPSGKPQLIFTQDSGRSSLFLKVSGDGYMFYDTGNGKTLFSSPLLLSWVNTGISHSVNLYGTFKGVTGSGQSLIRTRFLQNGALSHLNLSGNSLSALNLYEAPLVEEIVAPNNLYGGIDLPNLTGLKKIDFTNCELSYLNISGSLNLTGVFATGNNLSKNYVEKTFEFLNQNGKVSGAALLTGNSGIVYTGDVLALSGKGWTTSYNYSPPPTTTTTTTTTTTDPPSWDFSLKYGADPWLACSIGSPDFNLKANNSGISGATVINHSDSRKIGYLSDGSGVGFYSNICCDVASFGGWVACPTGTLPPTVPPTTAPPTSPPPTAPPTTTTNPPETTPPPP